MMTLLAPRDYERARPLLVELDIHLSAASILVGLTPAELYVDDARQPTALLARARHRFLLAGFSGNAAFNQSVQEWFADAIYPQALARGEELFTLYYAHLDWESQMDVLLPEKYPILTRREYYEANHPGHDWRDLIPAGFSLRPVDADLLRHTHLANLDALKEEMCSERPSVEDFLANSFGVCTIKGDQIAGWCLSEYNTAGRCEIGIETRPAYRRLGLATAMTCALMETALANGVTRIGWHCYARNTASAAAARKAGFSKVCDYTAHIAFYDEADNLTVNGNQCLEQGNPAGALVWHRKAIQRGIAHHWTYWSAARAAASLDETGLAREYLDRAIELGFDDHDRIQQFKAALN
jgi:GNAT superfamily N-acetyltransferase